MFPPFWKQDAHWPTVEFSKTVRLSHTEKVSILAEGQFSLKIDGYLQFGMPDTFLIPRGEHHVNIKVYNPATPPALYIDGETISFKTSDPSGAQTHKGSFPVVKK